MRRRVRVRRRMISGGVYQEENESQDEDKDQ